MRNNKGSLTVEACLSLTIFLFVFLTILFIMRIVLVYGVVQHSLNQAAKEISSYTYFYAASGLKSIDDNIQSSTAGGKQRFDEDAENIMNLYTELGNLGDTAGQIKDNVSDGDLVALQNSMNQLQGNVADTKAALSAAKETVTSIMEDPKGALKAVGSVFLSGANETVKTLMLAEITRALMAKYISTDGYAGANSQLKKLRVIDGLDGLNFSASTFLSNGSDIEIIVCYTIDPVFPIEVVKELNLMNKIKVRAWNGESLF